MRKRLPRNKRRKVTRALPEYSDDETTIIQTRVEEVVVRRLRPTNTLTLTTVAQPAEQVADVSSTTPGFENSPGSDVSSHGNNVSVVAEDTIEQTPLSENSPHEELRFVRIDDEIYNRKTKAFK